MDGHDRHIVISSDCHGGAQLATYREYLDPAYLDEFDRWMVGYVEPYRDMDGEDGPRNWDSARRVRDLQDDGVVAEVMYPNTVPPFFNRSSLASAQAAATGASEEELRWAGLQAHNRWLADFCGAARGRRAGIFQIMLQDIDAAVAEVRWAVDAGLTGGVLLPGAPPGSGVPPLYYHDYYDKLWATCAELGVPVNCHSGGAAPRTGERPEDDIFFLQEMKWWDKRMLRHLILGGVLERHPELTIVVTEAGVGWIPEELAEMDAFADSMRQSGGGSVTHHSAQSFGGLTLRPSEYWRRQCYAGASFMHPAEAHIRRAIGIGNIMWGSDYPHIEASFPYSRAAIKFCFEGVPADEAAAMLGGNAARVYGLSLDELSGPASQFGPTRAEVAAGIVPEDVPADAIRCPAFAGIGGAGLTYVSDNR
jgi:predicted TIM-barrel fold metal-dependent hydrolase